MATKTASGQMKSMSKKVEEVNLLTKSEPRGEKSTK